MDDGKRELKRCPICGSLPRYWQWNHGAIVECWCKDHRIQCEGKTLEEAVEAWERRADVEPVRRWIPVTERLPAYGEDVLLSMNKDYSIGYLVPTYDERRYEWHHLGCFYDFNEVDAWMPLPEPYKGGEEE